MSAAARCWRCRAWIHSEDDSALVCIECGGLNRRTREPWDLRNFKWVYGLIGVGTGLVLLLLVVWAVEKVFHLG